MPITYGCDRQRWRMNEFCPAMTVAAVVIDKQDRKILVPPPLWRMIDISGQDVPAVLCPRCGEEHQAEQRAAGVVTMPLAGTKVRRGMLGVLDGGKSGAVDEEADTDAGAEPGDPSKETP